MLFNDSSKFVCPAWAAVSPLLVGSLLVISFLQASMGASDAAASPPSASAKHGAVIFQKRCAACHNKQPGDDAPFGPPNLYTAFHRDPPLSLQEAETIIHDGKGNMPAFGNILTPGEIRSVIAYLRTRQPQATDKQE